MFIGFKDVLELMVIIAFVEHDLDSVWPNPVRRWHSLGTKPKPRIRRTHEILPVDYK